ncbi:MFS transporter [Pseudomonas alabamensis]|uniref:MFS transporter n=1 Tax=Pseudomonas alabamensis TaxID=3064349 RepID=UPI003F65206E
MSRFEQAGLEAQGRDVTCAVQGGKRATRLSFFIAGFALSCWAPLVPFVQTRIEADAATLGNILLCLGLGAVIGMPASGACCARVGAKPVILAGALCLLLILPLLSVLSTPMALGVCLLVFGAALGAIDVAANIHGMAVQDAAGVPLMSGFHGLYSVGSLVGAGSMAALIASGVSLGASTLSAAAVVLACVVAAASGFVRTPASEGGMSLVLPRGIVLMLGVLVLICFLSEGAMLDWGAVLLTQEKGVDVSLAGVGYAVFALAMTVIRLVGDRLVGRFGELRTLVVGFAGTATGVAITAFSGSLIGVLLGLFVAGLAVGNVVPALFTLVGRQQMMPVQPAVAAVSICGYLGVLLGPALIGYVAHWTGLVEAFYGVVALLLLALCGVPWLRTLALSKP